MNIRLILLMVIAFLVADLAPAASARYEVSYDGGSVIHVKAELPGGDGRLLIAQEGGIDQLPDQWATFVHNLLVTSADGKSVAVTREGKEGWKIESSAALNLTYDVSLEYAVGQWPAGNEQSGRLFPKALYTVTKPLFIYTSAVTDCQVHFALPATWKVAAPWESTGAAEFSVPSSNSLIQNSIVIGVFPSSQVQVGAFDITVATPGMVETPPLLAKALSQIGVLATNLFDKTPRGKYLMTFLREDEEDGESYEDSAAVTSPDQFDRAGMIVTGNTLVHELLHHWIGGEIAPADHDSIAWFTEGFTEYYANVAVARSGSVPPDILIRKLNNQVAGYLYFCASPLFNGVALADAGKRKGSYRFGVYNGGWAVAFSLDVILRSESKGRHSLDDVMRLLFERNGLAGKPLTVADIQAGASEIAGRDLAPFFDEYVAKRNSLPIAATLAKLGIDLRGQPYAADLFLIPTANPSQSQLELRRAMFGF